MKKDCCQMLCGWFAVLIMLGLMLTSWVGEKTRGQVLRYANVIFFFVLIALFVSQVDWMCKLKKKDKELYLLMAGCLLAVVNLFLARSNIGAIFTILDVFLMLYLGNKVALSRKMVSSLTILCLALALYWILYKHPMYRTAEFNPNGISHAICTPIIFGIYGMCWLLEEKIKLGCKIWGALFWCASAVMTWQAINLHARGTVIGIIVAVCVYCMIPKQKWSICLALVFTLLFPVGYIIIWKIGVVNNMYFAGKPIMNGRDIIWTTFMEAYLKHPIVGIGSNFRRVVPDLSCKEVHHALLDLLFVHGGSVFVFVLYFLIKRLKELLGYSECIKRGTHTAIAISFLCGMIVIGTFENYYIVAPCSTVFFLILVLENQKGKRNGKCEEQNE